MSDNIPDRPPWWLSAILLLLLLSCCGWLRWSLIARWWAENPETEDIRKK